MKKLISLVFCVALLFGLTACGSKIEDEALDALETSIANLLEMKSSTFHIDMKVDAPDITEEQANASVFAIHGAYDLRTANPMLSMEMEMEAEGEKIPFMAMYLKDNTLYMNMMDMIKQKQSLGTSETAPQISLEKDSFELPKEEMKEYLEKASLDDNVITLEFDTTKIDQSELKEMAKANGLDSVRLGKLEVVVTLKDKHIEKAELTLGISATLKEETESATVTMSFALDKVNTDQEIDFPDFSDYTDTADTAVLE